MLLTFDRYILSEVARPTIATILISLFALLAERALRVVDLVLGWQGGLAVIIEILSYLIPHYMGFALPAAFFLGILLTFSRLSREGELDAMRAAGFGLVQMVRPLLGAAVFLMIVHLALVSYLQPYSRYAYSASIHAVTSVSFQALLQPDRFITLGGSTYLVDGLEEDETAFSGLFLYSEEGGSLTTTVTAKSGRVEQQGVLDPLILRLQDGVQQLVPVDNDDGKAPSSFSSSFKRFSVDLVGTEHTDYRDRGNNEREMTVPELWRLRNESLPDVDNAEIQAELNARLVRTVSLLVLPFLGLSLSLGRRRSQRSYGMIVGIIVLVAYSQIITTGESLVDDGKIGAAVGLWLPFAVFLTGSLLPFFRTAWKVPDPSAAGPFDRFYERVIAFFQRDKRRSA